MAINKKIFVTMFLMIFLIGMVSSLITKDFVIDEEMKTDITNYGTITLNDRYWIDIFGWFEQTVEKITLVDNTDTCGETCYAIKNISLYQTGKLVDSVKFETILENKDRINEPIKSYQFYIQDGFKDVEIDKYEYSCVESGKLNLNGSNEIICENRLIGKETIKEPNWIEYNYEEMSVGNYTLKLIGKKEQEKTVDWIITSQGKELTEWTSWAGSSKIEYQVDTDNAQTTSLTTTYLQQSFTIGTLSENKDYNLDGLCLGLYGDGTDYANVSIWNATVGFADLTKNILSQNASVKIPDADPSACINITMPNFVMKASAQYGIVVILASVDGVDGVAWTQDRISPVYTGGKSGKSTDSGATWGDDTYDYLFEVWGTASNTPPVVSVIYPSGNYTTSPYDLNYTVVAGSSPSESCWYSTDNGLSNSSTVVAGEQNFTGLVGVEGINNWTVYCNGTNSLIGDNTTTFIIDTTPPVVNTAYNLTNLVAYLLPINSTWNYTSSDAGVGLSNCYYNTSDNTAWQNVSCNAEQITTNWSVEGTKYITYCANDTLGQFTCNVAEIGVYSITTSQSDNPDPVGEGGTAVFSLEVNMTAIPTAFADLILNDKSYSSTKTTNANRVNFTAVIEIPQGLGNSTGKLNNWTWNYTITGIVTNNSTATSNITIYALEFDDCSTFGVVILNMTLKDEEMNMPVNDSDGTNTEVELTLRSQTNTSLIWYYSNTSTNQNNTLVCVNNEILNNTDYTIDFTIGFNSANHVSEFYYLGNGTLSLNNNSLSAITTKTVSLMDLLTSDSTSFLFNYYDVDGLSVDDIIVHVFRKYIGEGTFREVERAKTDENGETVIHLVEEDVIYYFIVTQYGKVIYTSSTYTALCQATPCSITLDATGDYYEFDTDWDLVDNGAYDIYSNSLTRIVTLDYVLTSTSEMNLTVYELTSDAEYRAIGSNSSTGTTGELTLLIPLTAGNKTYFVSAYQDTVFLKSEYVDLSDSAGVVFGNSLGLFLGLLIILCLGLLAVTEGGIILIWIMAGLLLTSILGLINFKIVNTGVNLLIYIVCAGGILLWKLTRSNK